MASDVTTLSNSLAVMQQALNVSNQALPPLRAQAQQLDNKLALEERRTAELTAMVNGLLEQLQEVQRKNQEFGQQITQLQQKSEDNVRTLQGMQAKDVQLNNDLGELFRFVSK